MFAQIVEVGRKQYIVFGNYGYVWCVFLELPFAVATLTAVQRAFIEATSKVWITVERYFTDVKRL